MTTVWGKSGDVRFEFQNISTALPHKKGQFKMSKGGRRTPSTPAPIIATRLDAEAIKIGAQTSEVHIGGSTQSHSMTEAVIRKLFETAMKGSPQAQKRIFGEG